MQLNGKPDAHASEVETNMSTPRKRKRLATRKVTIRITEEVYEQLQAATERPGVGKSVIVEAALERFLSPPAPVETFAAERFDDMHERFDRLEHDMRMMAETVALHARYHLAVMPPFPQSQQHEATRLGDERFKVLAGQVDRRVRSGRPLLQETIDRLSLTNGEGLESAPSGDMPLHSDAMHSNTDHASSAAAQEGGSNPNFRHRPN